MTRFAATLWALASVSCATSAPYSHTYDPSAPAEWHGGNADRCVFGNVSSLCLRGVIAPTETQDVEAFVVAGIRQHLPGFENRCESADRTEIQVELGAKACIDCGPGVSMPVEANGAVLAFQAGIGEVDRVQWVDERGGTIIQVARRLGAAVSRFIVESARRCQPPNHGLQPSAAWAHHEGRRG